MPTNAEQTQPQSQQTDQDNIRPIRPDVGIDKKRNIPTGLDQAVALQVAAGAENVRTINELTPEADSKKHLLELAVHLEGTLQKSEDPFAGLKKRTESSIDARSLLRQGREAVSTGRRSPDGRNDAIDVPGTPEYQFNQTIMAQQQEIQILFRDGINGLSIPRQRELIRRVQNDVLMNRGVYDAMGAGLRFEAAIGLLNNREVAAQMHQSLQEALNGITPEKRQELAQIAERLRDAQTELNREANIVAQLENKTGIAQIETQLAEARRLQAALRNPSSPENALILEGQNRDRLGLWQLDRADNLKRMGIPVIRNSGRIDAVAMEASTEFARLRQVVEEKRSRGQMLTGNELEMGEYLDSQKLEAEYRKLKKASEPEPGGTGVSNVDLEVSQLDKQRTRHERTLGPARQKRDAAQTDLEQAERAYQDALQPLIDRVNQSVVEGVDAYLDQALEPNLRFVIDQEHERQRLAEKSDMDNFKSLLFKRYMSIGQETRRGGFLWTRVTETGHIEEIPNRNAIRADFMRLCQDGPEAMTESMLMALAQGENAEDRIEAERLQARLKDPEFKAAIEQQVATSIISYKLRTHDLSRSERYLIQNRNLPWLEQSFTAALQEDRAFAQRVSNGTGINLTNDDAHKQLREIYGESGWFTAILEGIATGYTEAQRIQRAANAQVEAARDIPGLDRAA